MHIIYIYIYKLTVERSLHSESLPAPHPAPNVLRKDAFSKKKEKGKKRGKLTVEMSLHSAALHRSSSSPIRAAKRRVFTAVRKGRLRAHRILPPPQSVTPLRPAACVLNERPPAVNPVKPALFSPFFC
jgi:hypothetical protein